MPIILLAWRHRSDPHHHLLLERVMKLSEKNREVKYLVSFYINKKKKKKSENSFCCVLGVFSSTFLCVLNSSRGTSKQL